MFPLFLIVISSGDRIDEPIFMNSYKLLGGLLWIPLKTAWFSLHMLLKLNSGQIKKFYIFNLWK